MVDLICDETIKAHTRALSRFKQLVKIKSALNSVQTQCDINSDRYRLYENRKKMWAILVVRIKKELEFLNRDMYRSLLKYNSDFKLSYEYDADVEFDIFNLTDMRTLYNSYYNNITIDIFDSFKVGEYAIDNTDNEDFKKDLQKGMDFFFIAIKPCIKDNYILQKRFLDQDYSDADDIFDNLTLDDVDKIIINDD